MMDILTNVFGWIMVGATSGFVVFILCACKLGNEYERDFIENHKVSYICDGRACEGGCNEPECHHTTDLEHAKNFMKIADDLWEEVER